MSEQVELGDKVKCLVTGVVGIVTSIAKCLNGCDRATIQPPAGKDKKMPDAFWVDLPQLKITQKNAYKVKPDRERWTGGPTTKSTVHSSLK